VQRRITTILVAAADMPRISGTAAGFLVERLHRSSPNTLWVLPMAAGRLQVLLSVIRPPLLPRIEAFLEAGGSSISRFLESLRGLPTNPVEVIPEAEWRAIDPGLRSVSDVDTPEDLATLRLEQAMRRPPSGPCS
jgi:molybdopterin-guanine dinucleotide biosynthesis protein A